MSTETCPVCSGPAKLRYHLEEFTFVQRARKHDISVVLPFIYCPSCKEGFYDQRAEELREKARKAAIEKSP